MINRFYILTVAAAMLATCSYAQTNNLVRKGNKLYEEQKYKEATAEYQEALKKNPTYSPGMFNLGNSLYQQKQFDASRQVMAAAAKAAKDKTGKAAADYNIGNTYMQQQKWEDAVDAYKQTLRNNPQDADAKYNLSYAEEMMKKNNNKGGGKNNKQDKNQQNKNQQNKNQQNKDQQNKNQQNKDQQNQQNKDQQNKDQDQQHPQSQPSKLTQQQADQLLNALQQEEKKLQDKQKKEKGVPVKMDKDW